MQNDLFNSHAEIGILSILIESGTDRSKQELLDELLPSDFFDIHNQRIFKAMREMVTANEYLDSLSIGQYLITRKVEFGGYSCLQEIASLSTNKRQVAQYVSIIKNLSFKRRAIEKANLIIEQANSGVDNDEITESIDHLTKLQGDNTGIDVPEFLEYGTEWLDDYDRRRLLNGAIDGLPTGISSIDEKTNGLKPGWLVVVAGRPSHGKTFVTQYIAEHLSIDLKKRTLFFSLEMSGKELFQRAMISRSGLNADDIKRATRDDNEFYGRISQAQSQIINAPMLVDETAGLSVNQIIARARRAKKKYNELDCIVIDYLGLIQRPKADRNDIAIGKIVSELKALAKELQIPVILLAQANRSADEKKRPTMANLKDSSDIEATADLVLFVHREEIADPDTPFKGVTEIIWAKDRHNGFNGSKYLQVHKGKLVPVSDADMSRMELMAQDNSKQTNRRGMM